MTGYSKVALAGKGLFGTAILSELVKAGCFKITVLTRSASSLTDIPPGVEVREVDYNSKESLKQALQGQEALVSAVTPLAIPNQKLMIDAAIEAGVKHFIPADYTMSSTQPESQWLPAYGTVVEIQKYLHTKSDQIEWTVVCCGGTLPLMFEIPFVIDFNNRTAEVYNGGNVPVSGGTLPTAGKGVVAVFKHPERIKDHSIFVHDAIITQNRVLDIAKKYTPAGETWTVLERDAEARMQEGIDRMKNGDFGMEMVSTLMGGATWSGKYCQAYEKTDNDWAGVEMISDAELEEMIKNRVLKGKSDLGTTQILPEGTKT